MPKLLDYIAHSANDFMSNKDPTSFMDFGSYTRPSRKRLSYGNDRTIITSIYNRIAVDTSMLDIKHIRQDENGKYIKTMDTLLNKCLSIEANADQTGRELIRDAVMSMLDEGCIAIVPTDIDRNIDEVTAYDIEKLRVAKIVEWFPAAIKVEIYNEKYAKRQYLTVSRDSCAIIENPFYSVMNEHNSVARRLSRKLAILDVVDDKLGSNKLNMIIQLPYAVKGKLRREEAKNRLNDLQDQLSNNELGLAYSDVTEKITQLSHPIENNLLEQVKYLITMLYSQLSMNEKILLGTATEAEMLNYYSHTIEPILNAIVDEMSRKYLTKTARSQGQRIAFYRNPWKLVTINNIADIADKFTRNEILSSNEVRSIVGLMPSNDPNADALRNKNMPISEQPNQQVQQVSESQPQEEGKEELNAE